MARDREEAVRSPDLESKRRKLGGDVGETNDTKAGPSGYDSMKVGATELASAFALASLATLSPQGSLASHGTSSSVMSATTTEHRSPHDDEPVPISPETRSPIRATESQGSHSTGGITPGSEGFEGISPVKRVTFVSGLKEATRTASRKNTFMARLQQAPVSRMPPGFARTMPRAAIMSGGSPLSPSWGKSPFLPGFGGLSTPPRPPPPMAPPTNHWICDFCNTASFATFQEACMHEETCRLRCMITPSGPPRGGPPEAPWHPRLPPRQFYSPAHVSPAPPLPSATRPAPIEDGYSSNPSGNIISANSRPWFHGSVYLAVPDSDSDWLSGLNCYIRSVCVEAFSAKDADLVTSSQRGRISPFQVGIRCCFCKHRAPDERHVAAISYPESLTGIYESVKRWHRVHLPLCQDIPADVNLKLEQLGTTNVWIPTTRQYWADSARALGMVDTNDGVRFVRDPSSSGASLSAPRVLFRRGASDESMLCSDASAPPSEECVTRDPPVEPGTSKPTQQLVDGEFIVHPEDISMVPPYVYFLMRQVETCHFTEADRFVARSKGPVGYPGFQCRHCSGHAGLGKYFPISAKSLATNSTSQNIHAHILKCRKCPARVKDQLVALKDEKSKAPRLEPGWRKIFFDKIWARMHA